MTSDKDLYTQIAPNEVWQVYRDLAALFRGGGSATETRLIGQHGLRANDFTIIYDHVEKMEMVLPDPHKGLSSPIPSSACGRSQFEV